MSNQILNSSQNQISIRNENLRFAFMFILFTLLAFLITCILFIFINNSYQNSSTILQRHFLPYCILGLISFILFLIFFIGSFVYIRKSLLLSPIPLPRSKFTNLVTQTDV